MSATTAKRKKIDEVMEKASAALAHMRWFEAERLAHKALTMAWQHRDVERMARIIMPLQEARRQRVQKALDGGRITVVDRAPIAEDIKVDPGCYLVGPPLVGADARRIRLAALTQETPVFVLCREPVTQLGLVPVVSTLPGKSFRAKVRPPKNREQPDLAWMVEAMDDLGHAAVHSIDPAQAVERRIDALLEMLDAMPEHEGLHQALEEACREAMHAGVGDAPSGAPVS
jgi:hypothetical protein